MQQIPMMPSKGKYIAGKQVSRWDAESQKVDIEYKNLDNASHSKASFFSGQKGCALKLLLLAACVAVGMIIGYVVRRSIHETPSTANQTQQSTNQSQQTDYQQTLDQKNSNSCSGIQQDFNDLLRRLIQNDLNDTRNYDDHLTKITEIVRLSGVGYTNRFITYVKDMWKTFHFDSIDVRKYEVTLSYPDYLKPNNVMIKSSNNDTLFESHSNITNIHPEYMPFNAYAAAGNVTGKLIYANYGTKEDFGKLEQMPGMNIAGNIVMIKYGKIHPANKVKHAEDHKAAGVIFYSDPVDFTDNRTSVSGTWWLPSWAVARSHVRYNLVGDPLTPGYASINGTYRRQTCNDCYPKIPCHPVNYNDARQLLRGLGGPIAPNSWFGGLGITYRVGPGYTDNKFIKMTVENRNDKRYISNLIAVIEGRYEKDKYVVIGAHIDTWTYGAVDSGTGYAIIWELARAFTSKVEHGWKPRRSILFALWDGSKYGHIGSYEWVQEYERELFSGGVAYINLDAVIRGNYSFSAEASPLLYSVIKQAADQVPCNDRKDMSVLEMWRQKFPDPKQKGQPMMYPPQGDSDHTPFTYYMGIPSFSPFYTYNTKLYKNLHTYPAFGTLQDTKSYVQQYIDPDYKLHQTVGKVVSDVILRLADSAYIPFDVHTYISLFEKGKLYLKKFKSVFQAADIDLGALISRIDRFADVVSTFYSNLNLENRANMSEFDLYKYNDKMIQLPRVFITKRGLPGLPQYRNILVSPHPEDLYKQQIFPGIQSTIDDGIKNQNWTPVKEQLSYLIIALTQATSILNESILGES